MAIYTKALRLTGWFVVILLLLASAPAALAASTCGKHSNVSTLECLVTGGVR